MFAQRFELPGLLTDLLSSGRWPLTPLEAREVTFDVDLVKSMAPEENMIRLFSPPFSALEGESNGWFDQFRHPGELDYEKAMIVGDFGPGSDNPIVLDRSTILPSVKSLSFTTRPNPNRGKLPWPAGANFVIEGHWIVLAASFDEFAVKLGLSSC